MSFAADHTGRAASRPAGDPLCRAPQRPEPVVTAQPARRVGAIDRRRAQERAEREWGGRRGWEPWRVSRGLDAWAAEVVAGAGLGSYPLHPAAAYHWAAVLLEPAAGAGPRPAALTGIAGVAGAIATAALRDSVLIAPEPGAVRLAYSVRDPDNGSPLALGWGFRPDGARALVVLAGTAYPVDELAGPDQPVGAVAVAGLIRRLAASFGAGCRPATHGGRAWPLVVTGPTSWTGRPAPPPVMSVVVPAPAPGPVVSRPAPGPVGAPESAGAPERAVTRGRWWPGRRRSSC